LVYVTDPRIATDIGGGTTFSTPTAPSSGTGTKAIDYITYGWSFFLSQTGFVTALGFWDEGPAGLASDHAVGLWNAFGGLEALVEVKADSPSYESAQSGGGWLFVTLDDQLKLTPGNYYLGAAYPSGPTSPVGPQNRRVGKFFGGRIRAFPEVCERRGCPLGAKNL
jgi:hypothetical protein